MPDASSAAQQDTVRRLVGAMYLSAAITLVVAIVLGLLISPILFAIAGFAVIDVALAAAYSSGRIGPLAARRKAAASGEGAAVAEGDPSFNPYARED